MGNQTGKKSTVGNVGIVYYISNWLTEFVLFDFRVKRGDLGGRVVGTWTKVVLLLFREWAMGLVGFKWTEFVLFLFWVFWT